MLHGQPGNGKTQALITIAEELDLPVYVLNIATMGSEEYETSYAEACADAPAMIVIEDLHATFRKSENGMVNTVSEFGVSFNTMLNCLSGVNRYQGLIVAFTTNILSEVDAALCQPQGPLPHEVSRPDRVDLCVEFKPPPTEGRKAVAMRVLRDESLATQVARETEGKSIAQVQDTCYRIAEKLT